MIEVTSRSDTSVRRERSVRADVVAVGVAAVVVATAIAFGRLLLAQHVRLYTRSPPLVGRWLPHLGPGTPLVVVLGVLVALHGPAAARNVPWRRLLLLGYLSSVAWTVSLALVDGWSRGVVGRLSAPGEYLAEVRHVTGLGVAIRGFTGHISKGGPHPWITQVAGHPPGALLVFAGLERVGLGGGTWAAAACVLVGCTATVSVPVALRALGATGTARAAVPFLVLLPAAIWVGVSADGLFTGVVAAGLALFAVGATGVGRSADAAAIGGGLLLGAGLYLSYGLTLIALPVLAVAVLTRRARPLLLAGVGVAGVVAAFSTAGFWWLSGYRETIARYADGVAAGRPYSYWVWADLAAVLIAAGPATVAGLRRAGAAALIARERRHCLPVLMLVAAAAAAIVVADLSGLSKAEVERIWLPFTVWLAAAAALLPARTHRWWLAAQVVTAVAVNHLLLTNW